jgi:hypothetical protein
MAYPAERLRAKDWKVTAIEAGAVMNATHAADAAIKALDYAIHNIGQHAEGIQTLHDARHVLRQYVIDRAMLTIVEDRKPIFKL